MGMFTSFYGEITCPSCNTTYKKRTPSLEEVRQHCKGYIETMSRPDTKKSDLRDLWAELDGFKSVEEWVTYLNGEKYLKKEQSRPWWGLVEAQTKDLLPAMCESFYPGDSIHSAPKGHLWSKGVLVCGGKDCKHPDVWIEIRDGRFVGLKVEEPKL